jgi:hypothetical protein
MVSPRLADLSRKSSTLARDHFFRLIGLRHAESARDTSLILWWTSDSPGGDDKHFAIAHYGLRANNLNLTAKSHTRLNRSHSDTVFRVRVNGLQASTTYYYTVAYEGAGRRSEEQRPIIRRVITKSVAQ